VTTRGRWALVGLVILAVTAIATAPVGGEVGRPPEQVDPASAANVGAVALTLEAQSSWVAPEGRFDLELRVDGAPAEAVLEIRVHANIADRGRDRFDQTILGENLGTTIGGPPPVPVDALERSPSGAVRAGFAVSAASPAPPFGVRIAEDGVYPVSIVVADGSGAELTELVTHLIRLPTDAVTPLAVALVLPVHAPPSFLPDGTPGIEPGELEPAMTVIGAVTSNPRVPLTLDPTPETLDALNSSGPDGTASVRALAGALGGREVLGGPYVRVDTGAFVASENPLGAEELGRQEATGHLVQTQLLRRNDIKTLVVDPTMTAASIERARTGGAERLVVPDDQLGPLSREATSPLVQKFDVVAEGLTPTRAVSIDPTVGGRLTQTADPVLNTHLLFADLAMIYHTAPNIPHGLAVVVPRDASLPAATYRSLLAGLEQRTPSADASALVSPVTLDGLFAVTDDAAGSSRGSVATRELLSPTPAPIDPLLDDVAEARAGIRSFASMATSPEGSLQVALLDRQVLVAESLDLPTEERPAYFAQIDAFIASQVAQIHAQDAQNVTLTSHSERIRVAIENQLDYAVEVEVLLESTKMDFPEGATQIVTLTPNGITTVEAAVESRASGVFPLDVTVRTPDQRINLATTRLTVRSTAISGIGLVLSIGAGLFLLLWWARHFRSTRRARRLVSSTHPAVVSNRAPTADADRATARRSAGGEVDPDRGPSATLPRTAGGEPSADGSVRVDSGNEGKHVERPHRH
jgi:hypothetical protein